MSSKITSGQVDDFPFVMTCLQNCDGGFPKPDFEKVAAVIGAKNSNACYHRLWSIKSKWGMTSSRKGSAASSPATTTTPKTPRSTGGKRGRPAKVKVGGADEESGDDEMDQTPVKKTKTEIVVHDVKASNGKMKKGKEEKSDGQEEAALAKGAGDEVVVPEEEV